MELLVLLVLVLVWGAWELGKGPPKATDLRDEGGHVPHNCAPECSGCALCRGGLYWCTRCNCAEGTLPTDCPGFRVATRVQNAIYAGRLDFIEGWWVVVEPKKPEWMKFIESGRR